VRTFIAVDRASLRAGAVGSHSAAKSQFGFLLAPFGELFPAGGVVAEGLGMIAPADGVALGAMTPGAVAVFGATFSGGGAPTGAIALLAPDGSTPSAAKASIGAIRARSPTRFLKHGSTCCGLQQREEAEPIHQGPQGNVYRLGSGNA
jgi:hypothetical protein